MPSTRSIVDLTKYFVDIINAPMTSTTIEVENCGIFIFMRKSVGCLSYVLVVPRCTYLCVFPLQRTSASFKPRSLVSVKYEICLLPKYYSLYPILQSVLTVMTIYKLTLTLARRVSFLSCFFLVEMGYIFLIFLVRRWIYIIFELRNIKRRSACMLELRS